ncbi:hypothetical protein MPNT_20193 [Candidatus Methylacidithermus pantelleriae]|uniref:Uncharacterized protein n=1 Tax=Candidatus Methylacidithermus pantelleriae TaxID=2744239 RepID=A0A8J2BPH3_9BACT|nr:hypothetical protein MPNT_20193 [Candidatus Methylacidithermus pantelleriae]
MLDSAQIRAIFSPASAKVAFACLAFAMEIESDPADSYEIAEAILLGQG